ncbi:unnamed protein product [Linum trigynum]|uniref:Uncharacterized protein n=1 Tax=Linum trigynum TaxID=586398 RepID=A0AAV2EAV4_9ROSI
MHKLRSLTITNANLTGSIPKQLVKNLARVDLSGNKLKGRIPSSIAILENLETLNQVGRSPFGPGDPLFPKPTVPPPSSRQQSAPPAAYSPDSVAIG